MSFNSLRVGLFLALRQVKRTSKWTTILIIFIMTLTFLNLVVVSGILVGLVEGIGESIRKHYLGDLFISTPTEKSYIEQSQNIIKFAQNVPGIEAYTYRYIESGTVESNYKINRKPSELPAKVATSFAGIDPVREDNVAGLSELVIEGEYLASDDFDRVLVGASLLKQYLDIESSQFLVLEGVEVGSKIRVTIRGNTREVIVKGILKSKVDEIDRRIFFAESQFRSIIGRTDYNVDEIAIVLKPGVDPVLVKNIFIAQGFDAYAKVQTRKDAEPKFVQDIRNTFAILGNAISSIGVVVAAITIFIVIFINAITRRRYIGILKGIGVSEGAIEIAYIVQSIFYAVVGSVIGIVVVFGFLKPYFAAHPIDFPFSDGILVAEVPSTMTRAGILLVTTLFAGYIPARMVIVRKTLDAILGR